MTNFTYLTRAVGLTARHPKATFAASLIILALSLLSLSRARIDSTLTGMLGGGNPAAAAMAELADSFQAGEDLMILAEAPDDQPLPLAQKMLLDFAARLESEIARSKSARILVEGIRYRPPEAVETYIKDTIIPAGVFFLDDAGFKALLHRLEPAEVRRQMAQNEAMLAAPGPTASALARQLINDPLRMRELVQSHLARDWGAGRPLAGDQPKSDFSDDGRALLILISGASPVSDIEFSKTLTAAMTELSKLANVDGLEIRLGGGYAVAATSATIIRSDAIVNTNSSLILLFLFFLAAYGRVLIPIVLIMSAGLGIIAAFGLYAFIFHTMTPLTMVLASMLAGLGVDYAIHFRAHQEHMTAAGLSPAEASERTIQQMAGPLIAACITTIFGFGTVILGDVQMLKDFAILGSLGLAASLISVLLVLPACLQLLPKSKPFTPTARIATGVVAWVSRHPRRALTIGAAILAACVLMIAVTPGFTPPFETDTSVMHPHPHPPLETGRIIQDRFHQRGETLFVLVRADSPNELIARCHDVARTMGSTAARQIGVAGTFSFASLLPDPLVVPARLRELESLDVDKLLEGVRREIEASRFDPTALSDSVDFIRRLLTNRSVPTIEHALAQPELVRLLVPSGSAAAPTRSVVIIKATSAALAPSARGRTFDGIRSLLSPIAGCTLTGVDVVSHELESASRRDLRRFGLLSIALVVAWLFIHMRRISDVMMALIPVLFSTVCVFGIMSLLDVKLNIVNIVSFPLLVGICVDIGIFMIAAANRARSEDADLAHAMPPTIHATFCTEGTTILGFGTLITSHIPAVQSMGLTTLLGVFSSLVGSLFFLLPLLFLASKRSR